MSNIHEASNAAIDREVVRRYLAELGNVTWGDEGRIAALIETPHPHRHARRTEVRVVEGKGFDGDHDEKSFYRGAYVPGREVSAIAQEVLRLFGVEPHVVGDNLITEGVDLAALEEGDELVIGDVVLKRSDKPHRPCRTFRARTSPEAFAVVSRDRYRGALFVVRTGGIVREGDAITLVRRNVEATYG